MESSDDPEIFAAILGEVGSLQEALDIMESGDYSVYSDVYDDSDLGYEVVNRLGELPQDTIESYFNYEAFGRDVRLDGRFIDYADGMIELY